MVSPTLYFYPRSPCGERPSFAGLCKTHFPFLSTLSLRRATVPNRNISTSYNDFYPRSPCGERQPRQTRHCKKLRFLSTLSLRRATARSGSSTMINPDFYPRSPCGERQYSPRFAAWGCFDFYPRSPCGERPWNPGPIVRCARFLSTLSLRRATGQQNRPLRHSGFLSTLSLRRATAQAQTGAQVSQYFYPRSPCGERPTVMTCTLCP